jgi:hypothetical protein
MKRLLQIGPATALLCLVFISPVSGDPIPQAFDLEGNAVAPISKDVKATVLLFVRSDCPISNRYAPEVRRIYDLYVAKGIQFYLVYPDPDATSKTIRRHLEAYSLPVPALRDPYHTLVHHSGARVTPEVAVYGGDEKMKYRGRIDNWYVDFGKSRQAATTHDLKEVLDAVVAGKEVEVRETKAIGCFIMDLE